MKKIMMAVAIVCAAVGVQAATVDWGVDGTIYDWNNFEAVQGTMTYLVGDTVVATLDLDSDGAYTGTVTGDDQSTWIARLTVDNFAEGGKFYKDYTFTMDTVTHSGYPSATEYLTALSSEVATAFDGIDLYTSAAGQGYTAVPEPTSGLLLLLGMAGLALRRKHA